MVTESLLLAAGAMVVVVAIVIVAVPLLQDDMRRTVERGSANDNGPDLTAMALMVFGGALALGVPVSCGWLWSVWS